MFYAPPFGVLIAKSRRAHGLAPDFLEDVILSTKSGCFQLFITLIITTCHTCRLIHAFTCAGILPRQYVHFSKFAHIGNVGKWYINEGRLLPVNHIRFTAFIFRCSVHLHGLQGDHINCV